MSNIIDSVSEALCSWSAQGILQNSRFAVIGIGYTGTYDEMTKLSDFTDSHTACEIIRDNNTNAHQGGMELQLDAVYRASDSNSRLWLSWSGNQKKVLIFTDEEMQQSLASSLQDGLDMVLQQCAEQQYIVGAFVSYDVPNQSEWVDLTRGCGGFLDYLNSDPQRMIETLNYWIGENC